MSVINITAGEDLRQSDAVHVENGKAHASALTCSSCQRNFTDPDNRDAIIYLGECLLCDHVRGELYD